MHCSLPYQMMQAKSIENDPQTEELVNNLLETTHSTVNLCPDVLILLSGEKLH